MSQKTRNLILSVIGTALLKANLLWFHNPLIGIIGIVLYIIGTTYFLIPLIEQKKYSIANSWPSRALAGLTLFCVLSLTGSVLYLANALNTATLFIMLLSPFILILFTYKKIIETVPQQTSSKIRGLNATAVLGVLIDLALLANVYLNRTFEVTPSPWQQLGPSFFFLYAVGTALIIALCFITDNPKIKYLLTSLHLFVTYSVAAIIYPLGFGFDSFTHRATEMWIAKFGFILPKLPLYIGQYVVVIWLAKFTAIKLALIDVYLVPILSALTLPPLFANFGERVFKTSSRGSVNTVWFLPFIYFLTFNLTTPYNILLIFTLVGILTLKEYLADERTIFLPLLVSITGLLIHPLLAAPLLLLTLTILIIKVTAIEKSKIKKLMLGLYFVIATLTVPVLFMLYIYLTKHILPTISNPLTKLDLFLGYFRHPYWYAAHAPWYWQIIYGWEWLIPAVAILIGSIGFWKDANKKLIDYIFPLTTIAFWLGGFLLRSWVVFPDVHALEQGDYPLRLLKTGILFLLPWAIFCLVDYTRKIWNYILDRREQTSVKFLALLLLGTVSFILTISFYLSYPQWNQKVKFPGYNVSASDLKTVEWIHADNQDYNYAVLTNPITAAAALEEYSFAKYFKTSQGEISYYSIPTGGPLFSLYTNMWTHGQKRETMIQAMDVTGANKAYFIIPSYWTKFDSIVAGAKKSADRWEMIDGGKIYVFVYNRK